MIIEGIYEKKKKEYEEKVSLIIKFRYINLIINKNYK